MVVRSSGPEKLSSVTCACRVCECPTDRAARRCAASAVGGAARSRAYIVRLRRTVPDETTRRGRYGTLEPEYLVVEGHTQAVHRHARV